MPPFVRIRIRFKFKTKTPSKPFQNPFFPFLKITLVSRFDFNLKTMDSKSKSFSFKKDSNLV
jgi:hypothetical protein